MTTIKTLIGAVALIAASTVFAQSTNTCTWFPKGEDGPGTIGKRYAGASLGFIEKAHTSHNALTTAIGGNLPICQGLDLTGAYSYSSFNRAQIDELSTQYHNIGGSAVIYNTIEDGIKPFIGFGLGYSFLDKNLDKKWAFDNSIRNHTGSNFGTWNVTVGAEFPYKWVSVIPSISYKDDFRGKGESEQFFVYGAEVNSWITPKVALYVSVGYEAQQHVAVQSWVCSTGVRVRF